MEWDLAANIINDAIIELGLRATKPADPYDVTDIAVVQLCQHLTSLGQDLSRDYQWTHLTATHTFNTADGTAAYDLPDDFLRIIDDTCWNRTYGRRMVPLVAQHWEVLQSANIVSSACPAFRIAGNQFNISPTPDATEAIAFEYLTSYWVQPTGEDAPTSDTSTDGQDTVTFDRRLLVCGLKLLWRRSKGLDTAAVQEDFDRALARAQGADGAARSLPITSGSRHLALHNVPNTGFGFDDGGGLF